jgi:AcrR family transcriptional regulator
MIQPMQDKTAAPTSARDRLLAAADELFYREGVHSVGIDRVIERAGVAKASLYSAFGSKDELIRSYLMRRRARLEERVAQRLARCDSPRKRLLAVFDALADAAKENDFRGCAFTNARAEAPAGSAPEQACDTYRAWVRELFLGLAKEAGASRPLKLAQQLVVLYDGAVTAAGMDRDPAAVATARGIAATLLDAALAR